MKKLGLLFSMFCLGFLLISCGVSESYANKINKAAEKGDHYTYTEVVDDLGEATVAVGAAGIGVYFWIDGCDTLEEATQKYDAGKTVYCLRVNFNLKKQAVEASWTEWTPNSK